jgi:hypothetical protein
MSVEENMALARRLLEAHFKGDLDAMDEMDDPRVRQPHQTASRPRAYPRRPKMGDRPLEPATDRCLVGHVLRGKPCLQVPLFSRDDHKRHERNGRNEHDQQAEAVDPQRKSELEERKGEVDGVPAKAIRSRADDGCRGAVARDGSSSRPEGTNCGEEESDRYEREKNADGRPKGRRHKVHRPQCVDHEAECDRAKVDERRTHEPEVGDIGLRSSPTVASQAITPYLPLNPSANSQATITGRVSGWVWSPGGASTSTYMRPERSSMEKPAPCEEARPPRRAPSARTCH